MKTVLILPTYNEIENLPKMVSRLFDLPVEDIHLLVIDDNSPDGTGDLADSLAAKFPKNIKVIHREGKLGLGSAYITGFKLALQDEAEVIGQMDSDFSHPPEKILEMLPRVKPGNVVIGSRYIKGGSLDHDWPLWRKWLSAWGNFYARTILNLNSKDVTGGFRLWSREAIEQLPLEQVKSNGYVFQVEMAYLSQLLGLETIEIPIHFAERKLGSSKMNFRIQIEAAFRVLQLKNYYKTRSF